MENGPAVLVVDDDPIVLELLAMSLAPHFDVSTASSGEEALQLLERCEYAVLLADQRMPGITGVELAAKARQLRPHVVAVLLSAHVGPRDFIAAINEGQIFRFVAKPWDHGDLLLTLQQAVERHRLARDNAQLVAEAARRLRALEILQAVVTAGARGAHQHPAGILLERLREVVSFDLAAVLLASPGAETQLQLASSRPVSEQNLIELRDQAVSLYELAAGALVDESRLAPTLACAVGTAAYAAVESQVQVPLLRGRDTVGLLLLQSFAPGAFPPDVGRLLDVLANGAAEALEQMRCGAVGEGRWLAQALAGVAVGVVAADAHGTPLVSNQAALRLLAGADLTPERLLAAFGMTRSVLAHAAAGSRELASGGRTLAVATAPLGGGEPGVVLTLRDVTDDKAREAQRRRFVSTVSHEIRTPLSAIVATIDLLLHGLAGGLEKRQREYLASASDACDTLHACLDDLLDVEKHAAGALALERRPIVPADVVRMVMLRYEAAAAESRVRLRAYRLDHAVVVDADRARLEQVLGNLLSNAIKYAAKDSEIGIELGVSAAPEGFVVLGTHNTGEPIAPADLDTIFDRFGLAPARRSGPRSSGLGLAICRSITEAHGGIVAAESVGGRTSIWVALPVHAAEKQATQVRLEAPVRVYATEPFDRVGLLATIGRAGLPARLLPLDPGASRAVCAAAGAGLTIAAGAPPPDHAGPLLVLRRARQADVHALAEALATLVRRGAPRLPLTRPAPAELVAILGSLGIETALGSRDDGALELPDAPSLDALEALAAELAGDRGGGRRVLAYLRGARAAGAEALLAVGIDRWEPFVAAYGPARSAGLRRALLRAVQAAAEGVVEPLEAGDDTLLVAGARARLEAAAQELPRAFTSLVRLHCRKDDRERGAIVLGAHRVELPTLRACLLAAAVTDEQVLEALGVPA